MSSLTGLEVVEAVQTTSGVGRSVQVAINQIATTGLGTLPTGGNTGQLLGKASATNFDASWVNLSAQLIASTGIDLTGSTTVSVSLASTVALAVLGVTGAAAAKPAAIAGTADQILRVDSTAGHLAFGQINFTTNSVTGILDVPHGGSGVPTLAAFGIPYGNAAGAIGVTAAGTTGWVLTGRGSALAPVFSTTTFTVAGLSILGVIGSATGSVAAITGAASQVPFISAAGTTVAFGSVSQLLDNTNHTQGSILYRSNNSWLALAGSTTGYLLQTKGTAVDPIWVGGTVLLNTLSPNGIASTSDTTSFSTAYRNYMVTLENVCPAVNTATLTIQVATSGATFVAGGYVSLAQVNVSSILITDTSTTAMLLTGLRATATVSTTTINGVSGMLFVANAAGAGLCKQINGDLSFGTPNSAGTTTFAACAVNGFFNHSAAITGMNFVFLSGNIATGTIKIYGMA